MGQAAARIGPYRLGERLGEGGGGVVYLARREPGGTRAALKTVNDVVPDRIDLLRREIRAIGRIRHPDVVQIIEDGVHEGRPWYAMTYVEAPTLAQWTARLWPERSRAATRSEDATTLHPTESATRLTGPLADQAAALADGTFRRPRSRQGFERPAVAAGHLSEALTVTAALCGPLAFIHGEGIVHRDLKPANIFLPSASRTVIADFGLAADFEGGSGRGSVDVDTRIRGTVSYMAPEQVLQQAVDARADLYSIGCILYELLTGQAPFTGPAHQVLLAHVHALPTPPSSLVAGIPAALDEIVMRLLAKDPAQRIGYAEVVGRMLEDLGATVQPRPNTPDVKPYLYRPSFIGRDVERRTLEQYLTDTLEHSRRRVVLVVGESGIGKSRTAAELGDAARRRGLSVIAGESRRNMVNTQGSESEALAADTPLAPLRPLLQVVAERCHREGPEYTAWLLGERGRLLLDIEPGFRFLPGAQGLPELPKLPADLAQRRFFGFLAHLLHALGQDTGTLLVLDDLQWADDLTLAFVEYLCGEEPVQMPLLVVGTIRSEENRPRVAQLMERADVVSMQRLDESEVRSLVRDMLASDHPPEDLVQFLTRQSEGNPFFVGEYLRTAVGCRVLEHRTSGEWQVSSPPPESGPDQPWALPLPNALRDLLDLRLKDLPDTAARLLSVAAVLGRSFDPVVCRSIAGLSEVEAFEAERELLTHQVLQWTAQGNLRFDHDVIREVEYERLSGEQRRQLHAAAARTLESTQPSDSPSTSNVADLNATLGQHWAAAGYAERAVDYLCRAADAARAVPAMQSAVLYYRSALEQLRLIPQERKEGDTGTAPAKATTAQKAAIHESLADVLEFDGQHEAARTEYQNAAKGLSKDAYTARARLLRKEGLTWEVIHEHEAALAALDQAAATLQQESDRQADWEAEWIELQVRRAVVYYFQDEVVSMNQVIESMQPIIEARGDARQRAMLFHLSSNAKNRGNRFIASEEVVQLAQKAVDAIEETDDLLQRITLRFDLGFALLWRGRISVAVTTLETCLEMARATGDLLLICRCLIYLGVAHRRQRNVDALEPVAQEALRVATAGGFADYVACAHAHMGWLSLRLGAPPEAREHIKAAVRRWRELAKTYPYPFQWLGLLPMLALSLEGADAKEWRQIAEELLSPSQLQLPEPLERALEAVTKDSSAMPSLLRQKAKEAVQCAEHEGYL